MKCLKSLSFETWVLDYAKFHECLESRAAYNPDIRNLGLFLGK